MSVYLGNEAVIKRRVSKKMTLSKSYSGIPRESSRLNKLLAADANVFIRNFMTGIGGTLRMNIFESFPR